MVDGAASPVVRNSERGARIARHRRRIVIGMISLHEKPTISLKNLLLHVKFPFFAVYLVLSA